MNNTSQFFMLMAFIACSLTSCNKDLGNYDYTAINEINFSGIDSLYEILAGEHLDISPEITATLGNPDQEDNFTYEWATIPSGLSPASYSQLNKNILSTNRNLSETIRLAPGEHYLYYTVTDRQTGVFTQQQYLIRVASDIYEGYLVLSDINGTARLDMLSYRSTANTMNFYADILQNMGSSLTLQGTPLQVYCYPYLGNPYGIYIMTSESTDRIHPEDFSYNMEYNIMYDFMTGINTNVVGEKMFGTQSLIPGVTWLYSNNNVYYSWRGFVNQMFGNPINAYVGGSVFKVSPHMAISANSFDPVAVLFNEDKKGFVRNVARNASSIDMTVPTNSTPLFDFHIGMDLIHLECPYSGYFYAILHDATDDKYYLARFLESGAQSYWDEITGEDIDKATHFAVSPELGYLFYSVGGKVYEYDSSLRSSKLMIDKGSHEITLLKFQPFFNRTAASRSETYRVWANWLHVASHEPANNAGTLEMYSVPLLNADLVKEKNYDGFGKIVSLTYRER